VCSKPQGLLHREACDVFAWARFAGLHGWFRTTPCTHPRFLMSVHPSVLEYFGCVQRRMVVLVPEGVHSVRMCIVCGTSVVHLYQCVCVQPLATSIHPEEGGVDRTIFSNCRATHCAPVGTGPSASAVCATTLSCLLSCNFIR
jgi:hypothetical protein